MKNESMKKRGDQAGPAGRKNWFVMARGGGVEVYTTIVYTETPRRALGAIPVGYDIARVRLADGDRVTHRYVLEDGRFWRYLNEDNVWRPSASPTNAQN